MGIFKLFIKSRSNNIKDMYRYWRVRTFYSIYLGYIAYYISRNSFKVSEIFLASESLLTKEKHGIILASFGIAYALSKFISGILSDIYCPKTLLSIGILASGIINIAMIKGTSFHFFLILWTINGLFQGLGWPPIAKILTKWYPQKDRGKWWAFWSTSHNVGDAISPILMSFAALYSSWRMGMIISGLIAILMSFFLINRLKSSPQHVNLKEENENIEVLQKRSIKTILFENVFKNIYVWSLIISSISIYFIRTAISPWIIYFFSGKGYDKFLAISLISAFELGGLFGSFLSGWISDRIFKGKRSLTCLIFSFGIIVFSFILWNISYTNYFVDYFITLFIGFFVYGPRVLLGLAIAEISGKEAASTASGFAGLWSYLSVSVAHLIVPKMVISIYFQSIIFIGFVSIISLIPLINLEYFVRREK